MTPAEKNIRTVTALNQPTAALPLTSKGPKYMDSLKIKLTVDDGKTLQNFDFLKIPQKGHFEHLVKKGTKLVVKVEGPEIYAENNPTGRKMLLKRIDNDLIFQTEGGDILLQLKDYYLVPDVELESPNWIEITGQTPTNPISAAVDYLTGETSTLPMDFLPYYAGGLTGVGGVGGFLLNNKKKTLTWPTVF